MANKLTPKQVWHAWESWRVQETERLSESLKTNAQEDLSPVCMDICERAMVRYQELGGVVPRSFFIMSAVRLAYDFGQYLANLEHEEASLTIDADAHDATVDNVPYAGEGPHEDGRFRKVIGLPNDNRPQS